MKTPRVLLVAALGAVLMGSSLGHAQVKPNVNGADQSRSEALAKKIYERVVGTKVPLDSPVLQSMAQQVSQGNLGAAADIAMTESDFINVTVKQMATKLSTREETIRAPFNDFVATFMGLIRDDLDGRLLLTGNFYYMADSTRMPAGVTVRSVIRDDVVGTNRHYEDLGNNRNINLNNVLMKVDGQQVIDTENNLITNPDPAGLLTSRTFLVAHAIAGTNRRVIEFAFREFMCSPIEEWADTVASDIRIGPDIDRFPGGDHKKFQTSCKGCHTQMDSLRGAFAYWDANGDRSIYRTNKTASGKYTRNQNVYPQGYVVRDNSFINNSNRGTNAELFGWRGQNIGGGSGAAELGYMMANSKRFSECMAKRVFEATCKQNFSAKNHIGTLRKYASVFETQNYSFKKLFRTIATSPECLGDSL